jgi:hypothetical protein
MAAKGAMGHDFRRTPGDSTPIDEVREKFEQ